MKMTPRPRLLITWGLRLALGLALGWGARLAYERRPTVRFAAGLAVRTLRQSDSPDRDGTRGPHLLHGQPHFFSLDQITAAPEPAAALREWRQALEKAPKEVQQRAFKARAEVSIGSLRRLLTQLSTSPELREEMSELFDLAGRLGSDLYDRRALQKSLMELARLDAGLALDGAQALESPELTASVWIVIAEDQPQRVIELAVTGQAPPEALGTAMASLVARDIEKAGEVFLGLPDELQGQAVGAFTEVLARTRPLEALGLQRGADGHPDPNWAREIIRGVPGTRALSFLTGLEREHPDLLTTCPREINQLILRQAEREPGFVFDWLERQAIDPAGLSNSRDSTFAALAAHDPRRAAVLLQRWPDHAELKEDRHQVAATWIRRDPLAALQWIREQPTMDKWLARTDWAETVPPAAAPTIAHWLVDQGLAQPRHGLEAAGTLVGPWMTVDPAAAVAWVRTLPEGPLRAQALATAVDALQRDSPPGAPAILESLLHSSPTALASLLSRDQPPKEGLELQVLQELPRLLDHSPLPEHQLKGLDSLLAAAAHNPNTQHQVFDAIARLPDPAQRQRLLHQLSWSETLSVSLRSAEAMPDPTAAREAAERIISQRLSSKHRRK